MILVAVRFGGSVLGRVALVVLVGLIGPGAEGAAGQASLVGAELEGAALESVRSGDHRMPPSSWAGTGRYPKQTDLSSGLS